MNKDEVKTAAKGKAAASEKSAVIHRTHRILEHIAGDDTMTKKTLEEFKALTGPVKEPIVIQSRGFAAQLGEPQKERLQRFHVVDFKQHPELQRHP